MSLLDRFVVKIWITLRGHLVRCSTQVNSSISMISDVWDPLLYAWCFVKLTARYLCQFLLLALFIPRCSSRKLHVDFSWVDLLLPIRASRAMIDILLLFPFCSLGVAWLEAIAVFYLFWLTHLPVTDFMRVDWLRLRLHIVWLVYVLLVLFLSFFQI